MAGGINLATKYSKIVDERWATLSQASLVVSQDNYKFKGDRTVVVYSIPIAPLVDYSRTGTSRYGTPSDLTRNVQTLTVDEDKSFSFVIDKGDEVQSEYVSNPGSAMSREIREVVVPAYDRHCFTVMAQAAIDNGATDSTAVTSSNAFEMFQKGVAYFGNHNVPIEDCYAFCTYAYGSLLLSDNHFVKYGDLSQDMVRRGQVGKCMGIEVVMVPETKLPPGASFLLVHRDASIAPKQLEEYKIHEDPPGVSGYLCEGRVLYDCFVLSQKADGIYYHGGQAVVPQLLCMAAATDTGKTSIIINEDKTLSTNKWYYLTAATAAALPTVTYGTAIDKTVTGPWYGCTTMTNNPTEFTPTSGHKYAAVVETYSDDKPVRYAAIKLNIG